MATRATLSSRPQCPLVRAPGWKSDCKRISGLYVGACWLRATTGIRTSESQSDGETSKATLVSGFIARRSDLFRHGLIATQFGA